MQNLTRTLYTQVKNWSASGKDVIKVPRDRFLKAILLRFTAVYDSAAAATKAQDGILNLVKAIRVKAGSKTLRSWSPTRKWYTIALDLGAKPEFVDVTTTEAAGKTAQFVLPIYFRLDAKAEHDLRYLLPAKQLSELDVEIDWPAAAAVLGANQTIVSGVCTATLQEVELTPAEQISLYGKSGAGVIQQGTRLLNILETEVEKTIDAAYTNFRFTIDLPAGALLTRSHLFVTRAGVRSDAQVTDYRIQQDSPRRETFEETDFLASQARDLQEYEFPAPIEGNRFLTGYTILDYADYGLHNFDLRGRQSGEVRFYATTIAPSGTTNIVLLHEQVETWA